MSFMVIQYDGIKSVTNHFAMLKNFLFCLLYKIIIKLCFYSCQNVTDSGIKSVTNHFAMLKKLPFLSSLYH